MNESDTVTLKLLAEYRLLTSTQLAFLETRSKQLIRRSTRPLLQDGLITTHSLPMNGQRGRPEQQFALARKGWEALAKSCNVHKSIADAASKAGPERCGSHHLLLNWFRLHLIQIERECGLHVGFRDPSSPFITDRSHEASLVANAPDDVASTDPRNRFVPDGILTIRDRASAKTLLFFLEVDMGTETRSSRSRGTGDVREKLRVYQQIFEQSRFRCYEALWKCKFRGFRVLFLTHTESRMRSLAVLVRQMPPSDFIWLTHEAAMFDKGISEPIWIRGGRIDRPAESILGPRLACPTPLLGAIKE